MSDAPTIILGGHILNSRFRISELKRPFPASRLTVQTVPGGRGEVVTEQTMGPRKVSFKLWAFSRDHEKLMADMADLATWLLTSGEMELSISDEGGRVRRVVLDGELDFEEYEERGCIPITLKQPDPYCNIGMPNTTQVAPGDATTIVVKHDLPDVSVSVAAAVRDSTSLVWGIRFDEGDFLHVKLADDNAHSVSIDCAARVVLVDGDVSMVTLDSNWPELARGVHTARIDNGTGSASLTWQERCL